MFYPRPSEYEATACNQMSAYWTQEGDEIQLQKASYLSNGLSMDKPQKTYILASPTNIQLKSSGKLTILYAL